MKLPIWKWEEVRAPWLWIPVCKHKLPRGPRVHPRPMPESDSGVRLRRRREKPAAPVRRMNADQLVMDFDSPLAGLWKVPGLRPSGIVVSVQTPSGDAWQEWEKIYNVPTGVLAVYCGALMGMLKLEKPLDKHVLAARRLEAHLHASKYIVPTDYHERREQLMAVAAFFRMGPGATGVLRLERLPS